MNEQHIKKPSIEEWLHYGEVVVARLTECVRVYKSPSYADVFIPDAERQQKTDAVIKLLHRIHALLDQWETPTASPSDTHEQEERVISGLLLLFDETRQNLGWLSADMQKLLKSPWMHGFPHKIAETLFIGDEDESEGIGSGHPEHGRLPAVLLEMRERERAAETRHPRRDLPRQDKPRRDDVATRALGRVK